MTNFLSAKPSVKDLNIQQVPFKRWVKFEGHNFSRAFQVTFLKRAPRFNDIEKEEKLSQGYVVKTL